ncbi:MAG: cytochrome c biogenesis protein CcsA [Gammaproteobacteria bacterium]|nr:cytochrome c biogenesis protein CcsA [Gammaproteobacteria bacterium]
MEREMLLLWAAVSTYVLTGVVAIFGVVLGKRPDRTVLALLSLALLLHGVSILLRWERLDHGPYLTMFEILSSNIWSLLLFYAIAYGRYRPIRPTAAIVLPLMFIMMGWMVLSHPGEGHLPPTYDTTWLVIHILFGKVFLGAALVAVGMAGVILLRRFDLGTAKLARLPDDRRLDDLAYRFMALGLIFDTLMLIAGAIWAQDAWGRYWAWDPLETWSFITWLMLAFSLHLRVTLKPSAVRGAWMILAVFVLAFLTFFGVPFVTTVPHQGAV